MRTMCQRNCKMSILPAIAVVTLFIVASLTAMVVAPTVFAQAAGSVAPRDFRPAAVEPIPYDLSRVVERALAYNLIIQMARLQQAVADEQMAEQLAPLRPSLSADVRPTWFETPVPDFSALEDILDIRKLVDLWDEDDPADFLKELDRQLSAVRDEFEDGIPQELKQGRGYTLSVSGSVPLWRSPLQKAIADVARLQRRHADFDVQRAAAGIILQSIDAYFGVMRAEQSLHTAQLALQQAKTRAAEIEAKVEQGTATQIDLLQAEAERYGAEAQVVQAQGELSVAKMTLNSVLGLDLNVPLVLQSPTDSDFLLTGTTGAGGPIPNIDEALAAADNRADVQKAFTDWQLARAAEVIAKEQAKPGLQLFGTHKWPEAELTVGIDRHGYLGGSASHTTTYLAGEQVKGDPASWAAGIEISWPLADGGARRAQVEQARLQAEQAALQYEHVRQTSQTEVLAAYARLQAAQQALVGARQGIDAATEAVRVAEQLAAAGAATKSAVIGAQLTRARAEQGYLEARYGAVMAHMAYLEAAGMLVAHWIGK